MHARALTGKQEGGAVGTPLAPERGEEVDELEHVDSPSCTANKQRV